jgi:hypothetical protein
MKPGTAGSDRLFALVDPRTHRAVGFCSGPGPLGECSSFVPGHPVPCEGYQLAPMRGTAVSGLLFRVEPGAGNRCALVWVDSLAE